MVQCRNCGLLAIRHKVTSRPVEAMDRTRETGMDCTPGSNGPAQVLCVANKTRYDTPSPITGAMVLSAISNEIQCDAFQKYHAGIMPQDHVAMIQQERMIAYERERDAWQRKCVEDDRQWREQQALQDRKWRKEDRHSLGINLIVGAIIGIIASLATLIAANKIPWIR